MAKAKKKIDMTALAVEGATVIINGVERDTYCAEVGTQITWSVSKEGYATQSGSFILREDTTLNVELGFDGFHFTYESDTMTILKGTIAESADTVGVFCIDGMWDIMINGTVLYAEGEGGSVTYGSEYLKSEGNDIIVLPRDGAKIYRRYEGGHSMERTRIQQAQYITEVLSWGSCEYGAMAYFFYTNDDAGEYGMLASIPALTEGFKDVTDFSSCFYNCSGLTSLPTGLFANCTAVTTFADCFGYCSGLTSLPADLFANNTAVTTFAYCFQSCTGLTSLPSDLFANNTAVTTFANCFGYCSGLTSLPTGLFDACTAVTTFADCFYYCSGLTGESPYSTISGTKVHLYERENYPNYFTAPTSYTRCFYSCSGLTDYGSIPDNWK